LLAQIPYYGSNPFPGFAVDRLLAVL
jgi:hypothetical protein